MLFINLTFSNLCRVVHQGAAWLKQQDNIGTKIYNKIPCAVPATPFTIALGSIPAQWVSS